MSVGPGIPRILERVKALVIKGELRISDHGYDELAADGMLVEDALVGIGEALLIEDYPSASKGPTILVLQRDSSDRPIHVVWGIPTGRDGPAVLVTAYRPDPARWTSDFKARRQ